jgi:hypothetical protein
VDLADLDGGEQVEVGQQRREALGEHRLTRPGRTFEEEVVTASSGHLDTPARQRLAADVGEVTGVRPDRPTAGATQVLVKRRLIELVGQLRAREHRHALT